MPVRGASRRRGGLQAAGAIALVAVSLGFFAWSAARAPDVPFLSQRAEPPWIMADLVPGAGLEQWGRADPLVTVFARRFDVQATEAVVALRLRALGQFEVELNGSAVGSVEAIRSWREETLLDVTALVRPGSNQIRIAVANKHGPGLFALASEGIEPPLRSGPGWSFDREGRRGDAIPADDTRPSPESLAVETPLEGLWASRDAAAALLLLGVAGFAARRQILGGGRERWLPVALLATVALAWLALFAWVFADLPLDVGFDARHHRAYAKLLLRRGWVPLATDGWSTYHPPLFYAGAAVLESAAGRLDGAAARAMGLKLLPFLAGLALVFATDGLSRRVFPGDRARRCFAIVFAGVLPASLYSAAYFSNETLTAWLAALALLAAADLLLAPRASWRGAVWLALLFGLGLLTKFTAVIVAAVVGFFVIAKLVRVERASPGRVAGVAAVLVAGPLLLAGWFYLRNVVLYGDPIMANWGHMPGVQLAWWQRPGFHTAAWYTHFGGGLVHPYLAGFTSFWDSLYTTLWGDGGIAGRISPVQRHSFWNHDLMSAGYLVALPATGLLLAGAVACAYRAFVDSDPRRRALLSLLATFAYAVLFGLAYTSLRMPYFAQAKASYGLVVAPVLALFFADGAARLDARCARWPWLRALFYGWLTLFAGTLLLAFARV